ncbi:peptide-binding protein [Candidatus Margulisiibacteriota bacterium]
MRRLLITLIALIALTACVFALNYDPDGKLIFSLNGEVSLINPILSADTASSAVEGPIFSSLIRIDEDLEFIPDLATKWKVSDDGLVWTFYLRKDVYWHDGRQFTSDDVKFTFDTILNPKVNSVRRSSYIINGTPIKFEVVDKYTIRAVLPEPFSPFLAAASMSIIPKHILAGKELDMSFFNRKPVGTGPFKFKEWRTGDYVELQRNNNFYLGKPKLKYITYKMIPDSNVELLALESGQIDSAGIPPKDYKRIKTKKGINVFEYDSLVYTYMGLNLKSEVFKDIRVRRAVCYATNRQQLINLIFRGHASPAYAPNAPISWAYSDDVHKYEYNLKKAEELLDAAGWKKGKNGYRYKNGKRLEFTVLVNHGNKEREKAAIILQQQYKKVGIKMDMRILEWSALLKIINAMKDPKNFDAIIIGWSLGIDPDSYSIWHSSEYPKGLNFIGYRNRSVDKLLEEGRIKQTKAERKRIYAKMYKLITGDAPYVFLWYPKSIIGVRDRVGGLSRPGPAGLFLNIEQVFVKE